MNDSFKERFAGLLTIVIVGIIVVAGVISAWPSVLCWQGLKRQNAELTFKIDEKKREIAKLIENQRRFRTDPDFVETIARQNNRVFPGELVFIFED
jgi:cell division protein FtsB